jgi:hypothetical protein
MPENQIPGPFAEWLVGLMRGEKTVPNAEGQRHHYTPEFLLRRFRGKGGVLYQLDKLDGSYQAVKPKDAAWEANLYSIESVTGEHNGIIEGFFSVAENFAARSLGILLNAPARFTEEDRGNLAFLLAIQEQRAPGWLEEWQQRMSQAATVAAVVELGNMPGPKGKQRKAREAAQGLIDGTIVIEPTKEGLLQNVLLGLSHTVGPAYGLPWTILRAKASAFVTSDRPLTMHDPTPPHKFSGAAWLSSPLAESTMPLSSTACLRICPSDRAHFSERGVVKQVDRINLRTYGWARRFIYGSSPEVLASLHARAVANPEAVPAPTKKRMVLLEDVSTADPEVAKRNRERGWDPYVLQRDEDGSFRTMSYEVIDSIEDAQNAVAPRKLRLSDERQQSPVALESVDPPAIRSHDG